MAAEGEGDVIKVGGRPCQDGVGRIEPGAEHQLVDVGRAIVRPLDDSVVAGEGGDGEGGRAGEAVDGVVAGGLSLGHVGVLEVGYRPSGAVAEDDLLDTVTRAIELLVEHDRAGVAAEADGDVIGVGSRAGQDGVRRNEPGPEHQAVEDAGCGVRLLHDSVVAGEGGDGEGGRAGEAVDGVVAGGLSLGHVGVLEVGYRPGDAVAEDDLLDTVTRTVELVV